MSNVYYLILIERAFEEHGVWSTNELFQKLRSNTGFERYFTKAGLAVFLSRRYTNINKGNSKTALWIKRDVLV